MRSRQFAVRGKRSRWAVGQYAVGSRNVHRIPIEATLDLHAFNPRDVASVVEEYVRAAHEAGLHEVRLIHGRGIGVQRGIVHSVLEKHPLVSSFGDAPDSHLGATVAILAEPRT